MKPVLRIPVYRRLLAAYALNELAFMIGSVALALLVYRPHGQRAGRGGVLPVRAVRAGADLAAVRRAARSAARRASSCPSLYWLEAVDLRGAGLGRQRHFSVVAVLALAFLDGVRRAHRAGAGAGRDGRRDLGRRPPAGGQRGVQRRLLGVLHVRSRRWAASLVAAGGTSLALLVDAALFALIALDARHRSGPARGRRRPAPRPRAGCAPRSPTSAARPPIRGLMLLQALARAVLHDLRPGRGRVRPAFAARRRGGLRRAAVGLGGGRGGRRGDLRAVARPSLRET